MAFIDALLWGTGLSLGMCVGLVTLFYLRPLIVRSTDDPFLWCNQASLEAIREMNTLTSLQIAVLRRIADAIGSIGSDILDSPIVQPIGVPLDPIPRDHPAQHGLEYIERIQAIVDRLPKMESGAVIAVGDIVWSETPHSDEIGGGCVVNVSKANVLQGYRGKYGITVSDDVTEECWECGNLDCYSTPEAAEAAKERK